MARKIIYEKKVEKGLIEPEPGRDEAGAAAEGALTSRSTIPDELEPGACGAAMAVTGTYTLQSRP